jgi:hypothetical protein
MSFFFTASFAGTPGGLNGESDTVLSASSLEEGNLERRDGSDFLGSCVGHDSSTSLCHAASFTLVQARCLWRLFLGLGKLKFVVIVVENRCGDFSSPANS